MTDTSIEDAIGRFVDESVLEEPRGSRDPLASELLDSLGIEMLIAFLEDEYGVRFADTELTPENFSTVPQLAALVRSKLPAKPGGGDA